MPLFLIEETPLYKWGIWKTDETVEVLLTLLPDPFLYAEEMERFKTDNRKREWLAVRVLLYTLLRENKQIAYYPTGKPFLNDHSSFLSISHTKGYVAVIVSSAKEVGIDIEYYSTRVKKIAARFMSDQEKATLYKDDDVWSLLLHWSAKETVFKALGQQDVDFREQLFIYPFQVEEKGCFIACESRTDQRNQYHIRYQLYPDFLFTWCVCD